MSECADPYHLNQLEREELAILQEPSVPDMPLVKEFLAESTRMILGVVFLVLGASKLASHTAFAEFWSRRYASGSEHLERLL